MKGYRKVERKIILSNEELEVLEIIFDNAHMDIEGYPPTYMKAVKLYKKIFGKEWWLFDEDADEEW